MESLILRERIYMTDFERIDGICDWLPKTLDMDVLSAIEFNLQMFGLHPLCEKCGKDCITYNAPNLSLFDCRDFEGKI